MIKEMFISEVHFPYIGDNLLRLFKIIMQLLQIVYLIVGKARSPKYLLNSVKDDREQYGMEN